MVFQQSIYSSYRYDRHFAHRLDGGICPSKEEVSWAEPDLLDHYFDDDDPRTSDPRATVHHGREPRPDGYALGIDPA